MLERPRLKAHLAAEVVSESSAFVVGEERAVLLDSAVDVAVLRLLDGTRQVATIAGELAGRFSLADVFRSLRKMEVLELLVDGRPDLPQRELAYWDAVGADATRLSAADSTPRLAIIAPRQVMADAFANVCRDNGIDVTLGNTPDCRLVVVLAEDYLTPELAEVNNACLASGTPWLLARPTGIKAWLGPLIRPGESGCWLCLHQRLSENRQVERYLRGRPRASETAPIEAPEAPAATTAVAGLLIPDILQILAGEPTSLEGRLVTLDRRSFQAEEHMLVRRPQCAACGDPSLVTKREARITLVPRDVSYGTDGGYRVQSPEETLQRLSHHISPLLGAVSSLTSVTESESGVTHSYAAGHNFALVGDNIPLLRRNLRGQSGGKGRSDVQARVSALAEAIERYSGVWRGDEPVLRATYDELSAEPRIHMADVLLFSDEQYDNRHTHNARPSRYNLIPERFRTDVPYDWTTAWSLIDDRPVLVPAAHVWFGHPDVERSFFTYGDGNGNASGNVLEEAVLQGLCELIERDSVALWWYNRLPRRGFDLDALDDPYVETLRRYYSGLGREFWLLDITSDLEVPAFAAVSRLLAGDRPEDVILGFGAHVDPYVAAMRALTEMNQFLPTITHRNPDGSTFYLEDDLGALDWYRTVRVDDEPWLQLASGNAVQPSERRGLLRESLTENIEVLLQRLSAAGLDVLAVDQSRPDLDLSVAKVIVPGLRHFWRRLAPGRLYDVPVKMGWLPAPLSEDALNPRSVFF